MKKNIKRLVLLFLSWSMLGLNSVVAQCAMCRVSVENNVVAGDVSVGSGLNIGILYLMIVPYLCFMALAYFWYKSSKKHTSEREKLQKTLSKY